MNSSDHIGLLQVDDDDNQYALLLRNWAIALSSICTSLYLFPFITAVAFGYPGWVLLTATSAAMVSCAALQIIGFLIVLFLVHKLSHKHDAHHRWGCVQLLPGIDASLSICMVGSLTEFIAFFASGCFDCHNSGGCCYTPIGPSLPPAIIALGLGIMATVFISRIFPDHHKHHHNLEDNSPSSQIPISKYNTIE